MLIHNTGSYEVFFKLSRCHRLPSLQPIALLKELPHLKIAAQYDIANIGPSAQITQGNTCFLYNTFKWILRRPPAPPKK